MSRGYAAAIFALTFVAGSLVGGILYAVGEPVVTALLLDGSVIGAAAVVIAGSAWVLVRISRRILSQPLSKQLSVCCQDIGLGERASEAVSELAGRAGKLATTLTVVGGMFAAGTALLSMSNTLVARSQNAIMEDQARMARLVVEDGRRIAAESRIAQQYETLGAFLGATLFFTDFDRDVEGMGLNKEFKKAYASATLDAERGLRKCYHAVAIEIVAHTALLRERNEKSGIKKASADVEQIVEGVLKEDKPDTVHLTDLLGKEMGYDEKREELVGRIGSSKRTLEDAVDKWARELREKVH